MSAIQITEDIPTIVAEEITAAQRAGIPESDRPSYVADRLRHRIGGSAQYVKKRDLSERDEAIRAEFNGRNARDLSARYGLTERRIRQIAA